MLKAKAVDYLQIAVCEKLQKYVVRDDSSIKHKRKILGKDC